MKIKLIVRPKSKVIKVPKPNVPKTRFVPGSTAFMAYSGESVPIQVEISKILDCESEVYEVLVPENNAFTVSRAIVKGYNLFDDYNTAKESLVSASLDLGTQNLVSAFEYSKRADEFRKKAKESESYGYTFLENIIGRPFTDKEKEFIISALFDCINHGEKPDDLIKGILSAIAKS